MTETADTTGAGVRTQSISYIIGWWILVSITGLSILNHLSGPLVGFAEDDAEVFAFFSLAALNIYALAVLLTAYRRGEQWAWSVTWATVGIHAMTMLYAPEAGRYYQGAAVVMAVAQLLTWSAFRLSRRVGLEG